MGFMKLLSPQMIPWCFHMAAGGGRADGPSALSPAAHGLMVRLIGSDGRVRVYDRAVEAAELMAEHPCHLVCRSDAFTLGQRVPFLSAADQLQPGQSYLLLPSSFFHSVLSFVSLATSLSSSSKSTNLSSTSNNSNNKKGLLMMRPFDIQKTESGKLQIRVSDEFIEKIRKQEEEEMEMARRVSRVCTTEALEKDYKQLVRCKSTQWKPKLETIREAERRSRRRLLAGFGEIRRRYSKSNIIRSASVNQ